MRLVQLIIGLAVALGDGLGQAGDPTAPYPPSRVITHFAWSPATTIVRLARGSDNWPITWADDDNLYRNWPPRTIMPGRGTGPNGSSPPALVAPHS